MTAKRISLGPSALCALILLLSVGAFYVLSHRLMAQMDCLRARDHLLSNQFQTAVQDLQRAADYLPKDYKIYKQFGETYFQWAALFRRTKETWNYTLKSKKYYLKATHLNPFDVESAYRLAHVEEYLEQLYAFYNSSQKQNPYNAAPYFKETLRLRPNGITYHYGFARYLYRRHHHSPELNRIVRSLARIYPNAYHNLQKESFWSPAVKRSVKQGLQQAVAAGTAVRDAHRVLSSMAATEKNWPAAIFHFKAALQSRSVKSTADDYFHLGRLYLHNRQYEPAQVSFITSLNISNARDRHLETLYRLYQHEGYAELLKIHELVKNRFNLSARNWMAMALRLIDLKKYAAAQQILLDQKQKDPTAEVYYWLARIAEIQKDWNRMELAVQKATVLAPNNLQYRRTFFKLLKRMGKHATAERELGLIIEYSPNPSSGLFDERARMRLKRKDYIGAINDWKEATRKAPHKAVYYAQAAEAFIKLGFWSQAVEYYEKAIKFEPNNKGYQKKYRQLKGEG